MEKFDLLISVLSDLIVTEGNGYTVEQKKELLNLLIELIGAKQSNRQPIWKKVINSVSKVYLTKELLEYISDLVT